MDKSDYLKLFYKATTVQLKTPNLLFEKANDVRVQEHAFLKKICGVPCVAFDLSGETTNPSFRRTLLPSYF